MPRVLIIDSEATVAEELDASFKSRGAETLVTGDGTEALKLAKENKPDLIVLCVELSRGSGYSVCNKLKKDAELSSIPLILTSSQATEETFEQHKKLRTRAEAYLKKPYDAGEVMKLAADYMTLEDSGAGDLEVSLDSDEENGLFDVSVEHVEQEDDLGSVKTTDRSAKPAVEFGPEAGVEAEPSDLGFSHQPTQVLVATAEAEKMRSEIRQLRQKVKTLEAEAQERELQFNDRLLEESARARDAVDIKKRLGQVEREIGKHKQAAEKASAAAKAAQEELATARKEGEQAAREREVLSDKIGQLVDKVKSLAAERDNVQAELQAALKAKANLEARSENEEKVRAKAKKAIEIAMQLIAETGLTR